MEPASTATFNNNNQDDDSDDHNENDDDLWNSEIERSLPDLMHVIGKKISFFYFCSLSDYRQFYFQWLLLLEKPWILIFSLHIVFLEEPIAVTPIPTEISHQKQLWIELQLRYINSDNL